MFRVFALFLILFLISGCSSKHNSLDAYRKIGAIFNKNFKLTRSDLIVTYDLGKIDNTSCIYARDLGLIINQSSYQSEYIAKFKKKFFSVKIVRSEALSKVIKIQKLLLSLHKKYRVLNHNDYQYIKRLSNADIVKLDARKELSKLDAMMRDIPILLPITNATISSHYGYRKHPLEGRDKFHAGIDIYGRHSCMIFASADGIVTKATRVSGYGNIVEIKHKNGLVSKYAHLSSVKVKKGQKIFRGEIIGNQGNSGKTTNEHLHFEILFKGKHINPSDFLSS